MPLSAALTTGWATAVYTSSFLASGAKTRSNWSTSSVPEALAQATALAVPQSKRSAPSAGTPPDMGLGRMATTRRDSVASLEAIAGVLPSRTGLRAVTQCR
jgi:hypothetical protein